jgi:MFS family permease
MLQQEEHEIAPFAPVSLRSDHNRSSLKTASPKPRPSGLASTFRSLRHRNYRLYFYGQFVSMTGTWMQTTALMWLGYALTHQAKWPALLSAAQVLPTFLFGAWGGLLADLCSKRFLLLMTQTASLALALLLACLVLSGSVAPWQLLVLATASGLIQTIELPTRLSFVKELVGRDDMMNAVALNSLLFNLGRAMGPALGGVLLLGVGPAACFLANGASFLAMIVALGRMDIGRSAATGKEWKWSHLLPAGFGELDRKRGIVGLVLIVALMASCGWPILTLLPGVAQRSLALGGHGYSLLLVGVGVGALSAACTVATYGSVERRGLFIGTGVCVVTAAFLGLSLAESLPVALVWCVLIGFGLILFFTTSQAVVQLSADENNRGRIMGIWAMVTSGSLPLGNLLTGLAADHWGESLVLRLQALGCSVAVVGVLLLLRRWNPCPAAVTVCVSRATLISDLRGRSHAERRRGGRCPRSS